MAADKARIFLVIMLLVTVSTTTGIARSISKRDFMDALATTALLAVFDAMLVAMVVLWP